MGTAGRPRAGARQNVGMAMGAGGSWERTDPPPAFPRRCAPWWRMPSAAQRRLRRAQPWHRRRAASWCCARTSTSPASTASTSRWPTATAWLWPAPVWLSEVGEGWDGGGRGGGGVGLLLSCFCPPRSVPSCRWHHAHRGAAAHCCCSGHGCLHLPVSGGKDWDKGGERDTETSQHHPLSLLLAAV